MVFAGEQQGQPVRLYKQKLTDAGPTRIGVDGQTLPFARHLVSPDGAFVLALNTSHELVRVPLDGGPVMPLKALHPGDAPLGWEPEPGVLLVAEAGNQWPVKIMRVDLGRGTRTLWRDIAAPSDATRRSEVAALSPDRKTIALVTQHSRSTLYVTEFPQDR